MHSKNLDLDISVDQLTIPRGHMIHQALLRLFKPRLNKGQVALKPFPTAPSPILVSHISLRKKTSEGTL